LLSRDAFRIASSATDALALPVECELLDFKTTGRSVDSQNAARAMRDAGCGAIVALGGDGTCRAITQAWRDVPLLPLSTGTNNVFPFDVEATIAGAAAGLVASGRLKLEDAARRAKILEVVCDDGRESLALIDAALLINDHPGSLLQADPERLAGILLTRADPASIGLSPVGGLLMPCDAKDEFAVEVKTRPGRSRAETGKTLRAPFSPGLYETVGIDTVERIELGTKVQWSGPGLLAFDGDREIVLDSDQIVTLSVHRRGPWVIEPKRAMRAAALQGLFTDLGPWQDARGRPGGSCC
jgi:hypothetical protein